MEKLTQIRNDYKAFLIGILIIFFNGDSGGFTFGIIGVLIFLAGLVERLANAIEKGK